MKLIPYSTIETQNLRILLYVARSIAYIAAILFLLGCTMVIVYLVTQFMPTSAQETTDGVAVSYSASSGYGTAGLRVIVVSMLTYFLSAIFAVLVSWENARSSKTHESE